MGTITVKAAGRIDAMMGVVPTTLPSISTSRARLVAIRTSLACARTT